LRTELYENLTKLHEEVKKVHCPDTKEIEKMQEKINNMHDLLASHQDDISEIRAV